jgi:hypothetical protein
VFVPAAIVLAFIVQHGIDKLIARYSIDQLVNETCHRNVTRPRAFDQIPAVFGIAANCDSDVHGAPYR